MDELPNKPEHDFCDEPNTAWMSPTSSNTPSSEGGTMCNTTKTYNNLRDLD